MGAVAFWPESALISTRCYVMGKKNTCSCGIETEKRITDEKIKTSLIVIRCRVHRSSVYFLWSSESGNVCFVSPVILLTFQVKIHVTKYKTSQYVWYLTEYYVLLHLLLIVIWH